MPARRIPVARVLGGHGTMVSSGPMLSEDGHAHPDRSARAGARCEGAQALDAPDHLQCYKVTNANLKRLKGIVDLDAPSFDLAPGCKFTKAKFYERARLTPACIVTSWGDCAPSTASRSTCGPSGAYILQRFLALGNSLAANRN